jgi:hypothetical protein
MADVKPMMIPVQTLKYHTHDGASYDEGDTYQAHAAAVENLTAQGLVAVVDPKAPKTAAAVPAKAAKTPAKKSAKAIKKGRRR